MIDGTIDFNTYQSKTTTLKNQLAKINSNYPQSESHYISLASELMIKRMNEEAATLLQANLLAYPDSKATSDSLAKAYKNLGKLELSQKYANQNSK
jgi:predicted Zn-dependent protease